jgi:tetrahydrodipicolinate N-succinyltransferase
MKEGLSLGKDCVVGMGLSVRHNLDDTTCFTGHGKS